MDNTHEVAVRPDGKELYVTGGESPILVVNLTSKDYTVLGEIDLPGRRAGSLAEQPRISFSQDSAYAYFSRPIQRQYDSKYDFSISSFSEFNKIIEIDTNKRQISRQISLTSPLSPTTTVIPSADMKWLYFTAADFSGVGLGVAKLDLQTEKVVTFVPLEGANFIALSKDGSRIYATQGSGIGGVRSAGNRLSVLDTGNLKVLYSVSVGEGPRYVAVTPDERKAYVSNLWSNTVSVIDLKEMKVTATIDAGLPEPRGIVITGDGKKAYVTYPGTHAAGEKYGSGRFVAVIDTEKDMVLTKIQVHGDPQGIAIDPNDARLYVTDGGSNGRNNSEVHIIDTTNDKYLRPIILRAAAKIQPTAIDVSPDGRRLFVVSEGTGTLIVIDTGTGLIINRLNIQPRGVKTGIDGKKVYVFSPQKLHILDGSSLAVMKTVDLSKVYSANVWEQEAFRIVLNRTEDTAYLVGDTAEVVVVDITKGEVIARIPFAGGVIHHSRGLALTPDDKKLLVSDYYSKTVAIIDTSTNSVTAKVQVGNMPSEIKISADGKRAYVLQQGGLTMLTVIDLDSLKVIKTLGFGAAISASLDFELSPDERYAYIAHYDMNLLMVFDLQSERNVKSIDTGLDPFNTVLSPDKRFVYSTDLTNDDVSVADTSTNSVTKTIKLGE
jgi:YVTN family beta-propeller protein